jgi:hypothetical protein
MAFATARTSMLRGGPQVSLPGLSNPPTPHCASVKSVAYILIPVSKNLERSLRTRLVTARTFQTASHRVPGEDSVRIVLGIDEGMLSVWPDRKSAPNNLRVL